jgi:hypothetical protein
MKFPPITFKNTIKLLSIAITIAVTFTLTINKDMRNQIFQRIAAPAGTLHVVDRPMVFVVRDTVIVREPQTYLPLEPGDPLLVTVENDTVQVDSLPPTWVKFLWPTLNDGSP